jgi:hypothetical protein
MARNMPVLLKPSQASTIWLVLVHRNEHLCVHGAHEAAQKIASFVQQCAFKVKKQVNQREMPPGLVHW